MVCNSGGISHVMMRERGPAHLDTTACAAQHGHAAVPLPSRRRPRKGAPSKAEARANGVAGKCVLGTAHCGTLKLRRDRCQKLRVARRRLGSELDGQQCGHFVPPFCKAALHGCARLCPAPRSKRPRSQRAACGGAEGLRGSGRPPNDGKATPSKSLRPPTCGGPPRAGG